MSFTSQYADAQDLAFIQRVQQAIILAAENISAELTSVPNHTNRVALAKAVLNNPVNYAGIFAQGVVADGTTKAVIDTDLSTRIAAIWNGFSGVA